MSQEQILSVFANNITAANSTGLYYAGLVNASSVTVGSSFTVNSTIINVNNLGVYANGGFGTSGQALTSNGSAVYWSTIVGTNTAASYTWTNTHTFNANVTIGSTTGVSANGSYGSYGDSLYSNGSAVFWARNGSILPNFPTGDYGSISGTTDAFGVSTVSILTYDCATPGSVTSVDLGTSGSI